MKKGYVYILASKRNGTLYTGVTSDLLKRVYEHKNDLKEGFTKKYCVHNLVYFEDCGNIANDEKIGEESRKNVKKLF